MIEPKLSETEIIGAIRKICAAIIEAVAAADPMIGAPGGHLYAAMMGAGCSSNQFEQFMSGLVQAGKLEKRGECYFLPGKGAE